MHRTKALGGDVDMMPKASLTTRQRDGADLAAPVTTPVHVENALDANAPVPAQSLKVPHQLRIGKAPSPPHPESGPAWRIVRYEFRNPDVRLTWYDGGKRPPAELA